MTPRATAQVRASLLGRLSSSPAAPPLGDRLTIDAGGTESFLSLQLDLSRRWRPIRRSIAGRARHAVQAYQPRALQTVDALLEIAGRRRKRGGMSISQYDW